MDQKFSTFCLQICEGFIAVCHSVDGIYTFFSMHNIWRHNGIRNIQAQCFPQKCTGGPFRQSALSSWEIFQLTNVGTNVSYRFHATVDFQSSHHILDFSWKMEIFPQLITTNRSYFPGQVSLINLSLPKDCTGLRIQIGGTRVLTLNGRSSLDPVCFKPVFFYLLRFNHITLFRTESKPEQESVFTICL